MSTRAAALLDVAPIDGEQLECLVETPHQEIQADVDVPSTVIRRLRERARSRSEFARLFAAALTRRCRQAPRARAYELLEEVARRARRAGKKTH